MFYFSFANKEALLVAILDPVIGIHADAGPEALIKYLNQKYKACRKWCDRPLYFMTEKEWIRCMV